MRRWTSGDLDLLFAHTTAGIVVTEDRCPHMAAPLSIGQLDGCLVDCVLHRAVFDLSTGEAVQPPTIGGLGPDGERIVPWTLPGSALKPEPSEAKARARALTRIRRIRFYPARIAGGVIEVRVPRT
jgi:nitrite reductase/ring-hydroxylating ferredoxin subunit